MAIAIGRPLLPTNPPRQLLAACWLIASKTRPISLGLNVIELALRLTRPDRDCLGPVIAAVPPGKVTDDRIEQAHSNCLYLKFPICDRIARPLPSAAPPAFLPPPAPAPPQ